jgi:hypothetical protein
VSLRAYTVVNVRPLPHQYVPGEATCGFTRTLEEAVATVREAVVELGYEWTWYEIRHTDGRRWGWRMAGPNVSMWVDAAPEI